MPQMNRLVSLLLAAAVLLSTVAVPVAAQEQSEPPVTEQSTYEAFSGVVDEYNAQQSKAYEDTIGVGVLKHFVAGEQVNVHVAETRTGEVESFSFAVRDDLTVVDVRPSESSDATARIDVSRAVVEDLMVADDPVSRLKWHFFQGNVDVRGARGGFLEQWGWTLTKAGIYEVRMYWHAYRSLQDVLGQDISYSLWRYFVEL